ncbi:MAG TPA: N-acetyl-alpha-D-glucosaminyl L-malate synthase BshA [Flavobacteriales bacterium]|jgi:N-acetyl-alpha-D-glucosaminyl L-malate synthase BshA|nr:N-acetyl-alpha-D-glucosaminyl L-malate synthase BshA [Flavobacteriales bacterium]
MRIGIVCYPTFGGSGVVATELGLALAREGHVVHFITYDRPVRMGDHTANVFYHEVRVSDYPLFDYQPYELVLTSKLVDVVKHERLDLLHVHYAIPHASAAWMAQQILLAQGIQIPFITTLHGTDITLLGRDPSFEPVITFAMERSTAVTAVSESLRNDTYLNFPLKREIKVIPNFIRIEGYPCNEMGLRKRFAPNGERLMVHVSNFRPVKRVEDVLKVFLEVRKQIPTRLLLIGDGPERQRLEAFCRAEKICDEVCFLGKMVAPEEVVACTDLFVLTSETESFGLAALEAMACGVPVISTNTGGTPEVNRDGVSGLLSPVGDIADMAKNALTILKDDASLQRFRDGALSEARKFDVQRILPVYEALYSEVIHTVTANGVHQ